MNKPTISDTSVRRLLSALGIDTAGLPMGRSGPMPALASRADHGVEYFHDTDEESHALTTQPSYEAIDRMREDDDRRSHSVVGEMARRMGPKYVAPGETRPDARRGLARTLETAIEALHEGRPPISLASHLVHRWCRDWRVPYSPVPGDGPTTWREWDEALAAHDRGEIATLPYLGNVTHGTARVTALDTDAAVTAVCAAAEAGDQALRDALRDVERGQYDHPEAARVWERVASVWKRFQQRCGQDHKIKQLRRRIAAAKKERQVYVDRGYCQDRAEWLTQEIGRWEAEIAALRKALSPDAY